MKTAKVILKSGLSAGQIAHALSVMVMAAVFTGCGDGGNPPADFRWKANEGGGATIFGYVGTSQSVKIPAKLDGKRVTTIGERAFAEKELNSLTIPNSVTTIENEAFRGNLLTSVTIPNSVTTIRWIAFEGNQLTSVTIHNSVTEIGYMVFRGNPLTSVTIGANVDVWDDSFDGDFRSVYDSGGQQAGTYIKTGGSWSKQ